jgi:hypothetical protein
MYGVIVPREFRSQRCNTWSLATHQWELMIGFGSIKGTNVFHKCKLCGREEEVRLEISPESIMEIKLSD